MEIRPCAFNQTIPDFSLSYLGKRDQLKEMAKAFFHYFGSHCVGGHITFRLYAPNALQVKVIRIGSSEHLVMEKTGHVWELATDQFRKGDHYIFNIQTHHGKWCEKLDPFSFTNHNNYLSAETKQITSRITCCKSYKWNDDDWMKNRKKCVKEGINIYEVYPNCWKKDENNHVLKYQELAPQLVEYCKKMSYTHIQLMATLDYQQDHRSHGFKVNSYFSTNSRLGTKKDFQYFVNHLHENNIGLILVWMPNHFSRESNGLREFDGTKLFEGAATSDWGTAFDLSRPEAQNLLFSSAFYWAEEMHVDGFYMDCTGGMLYRGGKKREDYNPECVEAQFLRDLNALLHNNFPGIITFSEDTYNTPGWSNFNRQDSSLFDFVWHFPFKHTAFNILKEVPSEEKTAVHFKSLIQTENCLLPFSHDEPGGDIHKLPYSLFRIMHGTDEQKFARLKLLHALTIASPGKKLIFMGHDFGQLGQEAWNFRLFNSFDEKNGEIKPGSPSAVAWEQLELNCHRELHNLHKYLNKLYLEEPAFWAEENLDKKGIKNVSYDPYKRTLSFERFASVQRVSILCVFNFSENTVPDHQSKLKGIESFNPLFTLHDSNALYKKEDGSYCIAMQGLSALFLNLTYQ